MNNLPLEYKDPVVLIETAQDYYGDNAPGHIEYLNGLFVQGTSQSESRFVEGIATDAHIYLDIENPYVLENAFRLEGMYLICNLFGGEAKDAWYKIARCKVGQRKLLGNEVNNIHCFLTKCAALFEVEDKNGMESKD